MIPPGSDPVAIAINAIGAVGLLVLFTLPAATWLRGAAAASVLRQHRRK
jgi:hypothetical protein